MSGLEVMFLIWLIKVFAAFMGLPIPDVELPIFPDLVFMQK